MKKSVMTAICAATLLAGMTAYANEYPVTHPFYLPDKGEVVSSTSYNHYDCKLKSPAAKQLLGDKYKVDVVSEDLGYGISDKIILIGGYCHEAFDYKGLYNDSDKNHYWYLGLGDKFIDDGKTFFYGSFDYCQYNGDSVDKSTKYYDLFLKYGKKLDWADPYISVYYTNSMNRGSDNDAYAYFEGGIYKQVNDKLGLDVNLDYYHNTDALKEKFLGATVDLRYAFTQKAALTLGYRFQLSDSQHKDSGELGDISFKTKTYDGFFANLTFAF